MAIEIPYSEALFADICEDMADYLQTGWTVCGAEDPAVIVLGPVFGMRHQDLAEYSAVRVIDRYVNSGKSDTFLEFSNNPPTDEEIDLNADIEKED